MRALLEYSETRGSKNKQSTKTQGTELGKPTKHTIKEQNMMNKYKDTNKVNNTQVETIKGQ